MGALVAATALTASGCGRTSGPAPAATAPAPTARSTTTTTAPAPATTTTVPATTTTTVAEAFAYQVSGPLTAADLPYSWRPGCPVPPGQLRRVQLRYRGFDHAVHEGAIVVNDTVVPGVVKVFADLFAGGFPIREMVPVDAYRGSDDAAAAADDTSGFNCRRAVASGAPQWSEHAYGEAIDVNDVENPYVFGSTVIPPAGASYTDRRNVRPGMATDGGPLVDAFASIGWKWGGRWTGSPDYQHFSLNGD